MHTHYRLPINSILERKGVQGVMAPGPDYGRRGALGKKKKKDKVPTSSKHANKRSLALLQITDPDNSVFPSPSLISASMFRVSGKVKCVTLGPDGSPAGWGPC